MITIKRLTTSFSLIFFLSLAAFPLWAQESPQPTNLKATPSTNSVKKDKKRSDFCRIFNKKKSSLYPTKSLQLKSKLVNRLKNLKNVKKHELKRELKHELKLNKEPKNEKGRNEFEFGQKIV